MNLRQRSILVRYGYLWVTLVLFVGSVLGHWAFGWYAFVNEQETHGQAPQVNEFVIEMGRDTLENWQSEFLQLIWQVAGLALLLYLGSPQSKEGDDRLEEKMDLALKALNVEDSELKKIDRKYGRA